MAEGVGFEPTETRKTSTVFETVPFGRSGTLPPGRLAALSDAPNQVTARGRQLLDRHEVLKIGRCVADDPGVTDVDLFPDEAEFTARPAWMVIEAARRQFLTGRLLLDTSPPSLVYLRDGFAYFAERSTDGALSVRLLVEGVISREQMQRGTLVVNGVEHLGRMFDRDPSIERASAELCVELFRDEVLTSTAEEQVTAYRMEMYRRHPSGIDRWFPPIINVVTQTIEGGTPVRARHVQNVPPITRSVPVVAAAAERPRIVDEINATREMPVIPGFEFEMSEPSSLQQAPAVTAQRAAVEADVAEHVVVHHPPSYTVTPSTQEVPLPAPVEDPMFGFDAMSTAIADEVAEAVRRALAAIDAAAQPMPQISPADFGAVPIGDSVPSNA